MNEEVPQVHESKAKKVTTTIRFDADLHDALNTFVYEAGRGVPPKERPSKDALVQAAVRKLIKENSPKDDNKIANNALNNAKGEYNVSHLINTANELADIAASLSKAAREIHAAFTAHPDNPNNDKRIRDSVSKTIDNAGAVLAITAEIKRGRAGTKRSKRSADR